MTQKCFENAQLTSFPCLPLAFLSGDPGREQHWQSTSAVLLSPVNVSSLSVACVRVVGTLHKCARIMGAAGNLDSRVRL